MSKFKELLNKKLKVGEKEKEFLPAGYQRIGDIVILNLDKKIKKKEKQIALAIKELFPSVKTICIREGKIVGKLRKPKIKVILGKETETIHHEGDCLYKLDVKKAMFSQGNLFERHRISKNILKNQTIIDMFAGIGYFSIPFAKQGAKVYAIELAKDSYEYLIKNAKLNKVNKNLIAIQGDSKKESSRLAKKGIKADVISMGYIPTPLDFFKYALKISKPNALILFHCLLSKYPEKEKKDLDKIILQLKGDAKDQDRAFSYSKHFVKSFSPGNNHWVLEIKLIK